MALPDSPQQQLDWEARHRMRAAIASGVAAVAILAGPILEQALVAGAPPTPLLDALQKLAAPGSVLDQPTGQLSTAEYIDDHAIQLIATHAITAIGYFALAYAVTFLAAAVRARRPEYKRWAFYVPIIGAVLFGVAWLGFGFGRISDVRGLLDSPRTIADVQDIGDTGISRVSQVLLQPAALVLAAGLVLVSLNGMRSGVLTRFMGALGIIGAVLQVLQFGAGIPLVMAFWLGGLAVLYAGRRPGGDPPAWRTGRAEPWPSAQQVAEARKAQQEQAEPPPEPDPEPERVPAGAHPATSKRKRKRRS